MLFVFNCYFSGANLGKYSNNLIIDEPQEIEITEKDQPTYIFPRLAPEK